jgi:serine/threonine protein kinase
LKPENILIDKNFDVKIADFGFSCELNTNKLTNFKSGTIGYMLPEQFREEPYNGRDADLFASAVVLFMMLTGCMPFNAAKEDDEYYKFIVKGKFEKFWSIYKDAAPNIS